MAGVAFTSTYGAVTVDTTVGGILIMASNPLRKGCLIVNNGSVTIYLGMDNSVTSSTGLPLAANATFNNSGFNDLWKGAIWGITASSSSDTRFWEWGP